jgi:GPH family glycoside/pentoside/hexuronide:cation symporter
LITTIQPPARAARLPFALKFGWGIGAVGSVTMMIVVNVMLLFFMVSVLGMSPALSGLILGGVRLADMAIDPLMGVLSDRTRSRWGRRRPWMLAGALGSGVATVALFHVPSFGSSIATALYMAAVLAMYYVSYSMFYVPYIAMPAEMTDDYDERTSIMSFRTAFSGVAGLIGLGLAPFLIGLFGSTREGFGRMGWVMGACVVAAMLIAVGTTAGARQSASGGHVSIANSIGVLRNRNFSMLLLAKLVAFSAIACNAAVALLFQIHYTRRGADGLAIIGTCQHLTTIVSIPGWIWLAQRFEKRTLLLWSLVGYAAVSLSWLASGPAETDAVFVARGVVIGIFYAGVVLLTLSMLPDVTADEQHRTGRQVGGAMAGLFAGIEKTAWALGPVVTGIALSLTGFVGGKDPGIVQSAEAIRGIALVSAVLPAVAYLLAIPFLFGYSITRERAMAEVAGR